MLNAGWNMLFQRFHVYRNVFARFLWKNEAKEREKSNFGELPRAISTWKLVLIYNSWTFWEQLCLFIIIYIVSKCANNYVFRKWKCKVFLHLYSIQNVIILFDLNLPSFALCPCLLLEPWRLFAIFLVSTLSIEKLGKSKVLQKYVLKMTKSPLNTDCESFYFHRFTTEQTISVITIWIISRTL